MRLPLVTSIHYKGTIGPRKERWSDEERRTDWFDLARSATGSEATKTSVMLIWRIGGPAIEAQSVLPADAPAPGVWVTAADPEATGYRWHRSLPPRDKPNDDIWYPLPMNINAYPGAVLALGGHLARIILLNGGVNGNAFTFSYTFQTDKDSLALE